MDSCALPISISALACALANQIDDTEQLTLLSVILMQLSDTLATIVAQRAICQTYCENKQSPERSNENYISIL